MNELEVKNIAEELKNLKSTKVDDDIRYLENDIKRINRYIEDAQYNINRYYNDLKGKMVEIEVLRIRLNETVDFTSEIKAILEHPVVESIKVHNGKEFSIFTDYIDIFDEKGNRFRGNKYELRFNYNRMNCRIFGLDEDLCRKSYWSDKDPHPHVDGNSGSACWGDAGSMLAISQNEYELYASFIIVFNFLQQVNTSDVAGKNIRNWDCIDDDDNDLDNPYENMYDTECHICYEELTDGDDNCFYCDDCERYACDHCVTWIESEQRYVCDECASERYTSCSCCGDYFDNDDVTEINGDNYCSDCRDDKFDMCSECGEYYRKDEITEIDGFEYCETCRDRKFRECGACYEWYEKDEITVIDGENYCESCRDDRFVQCDECSQWSEDTFYCDNCGGTFCKGCREEIDEMCDGCYENSQECEDEE